MRFLLFLGACLLLFSQVGHAQQPVLPGAPVVPPGTLPATPLPPPSQTAALPTAEVVGHPGEIIGQAYNVETTGGTQFNGTLREATDLALTFETRELGLVTVQRANVRQLMGQTSEQMRHGFDYVGNGTQMFIAPTARNLHQGEGYGQDINVFLLGVNYGLTDNISVGLLVPVIPFVGVPFVAITPKVSVPVTDKLHLGASLLYGFAKEIGGGNSGSGGVGFGLATYGTADTNVTFGLGYGVSSNSIDHSPVGMVGANVRVSRRFSLVNETYLASLTSDTNVVGLAGLRYASPRFSASFGALYYTFYNGGIYPAYLDVALHFGKIKLR